LFVCLFDPYVIPWGSKYHAHVGVAHVSALSKCILGHVVKATKLG